MHPGNICEEKDLIRKVRETLHGASAIFICLIRMETSCRLRVRSDPRLIDKVRDIVGLYMNPPQDALVLCVDEKSQIQTLSRRQPILPLRSGQLERRPTTINATG